MKRIFTVVRSSVICLLAMMGGATLASSTELAPKKPSENYIFSI